MTTLPISITIAGKEHPTAMPGFSMREDITVAWSEAGTAGSWQHSRRALAAAIGACTTIPAACGVTYARAKYDPLGFGGHIYDHLRGQGASTQEIVEVGTPLMLAMLEDLFPREEEVAEAAGFTDADEDTST